MLILTRKPGESLYIGDVKVTIVELKGHQIRIGIAAPPEIRIYREEIYLQILEENRKAAESSNVTEAGLAGLGTGWKGSSDNSDDEDGSDQSKKRKHPTLSSLSIKPTEPQVFKRKKVRSTHDPE